MTRDSAVTWYEQPDLTAFALDFIEQVIKRDTHQYRDWCRSVGILPAALPHPTPVPATDLAGAAPSTANDDETPRGG